MTVVGGAPRSAPPVPSTGAAAGSGPSGDGSPDASTGGSWTSKLGDLAAEAGLERIHILAWRDLEDVEAGGSELHAAEVARRWAAAGIEVTFRTSWAQGQPPVATRDGYRVIRRGGRYNVFPRAVISELRGRHGPRDGLVEIFNGMPFFSPVWARGPRIVLLHHVHAEMWRMVLPPQLAAVGETIELRLAPLVYRRSRIVTLSESSRREIHRRLGVPLHRIDVVPPGVDGRFRPGPGRDPRPLVVAVGRLVPVKRHHLLIDALCEARRTVGDLRAVFVGDGYERTRLEEHITAVGASDWIRIRRRVSDEELVDLYRRAWLLVSASAREGWGMTITEAAACGTPAVVTDTVGHRDAVVDGVTGVLAPDAELGRAVARVLRDRNLLDRLGRAARRRAAGLTWDRTAYGVLRALATEATRHRRARPATGVARPA